MRIRFRKPKPVEETESIPTEEVRLKTQRIRDLFNTLSQVNDHAAPLVQDYTSEFLRLMRPELFEVTAYEVATHPVSKVVRLHIRRLGRMDAIVLNISISDELTRSMPAHLTVSSFVFEQALNYIRGHVGSSNIELDMPVNIREGLDRQLC